MLTRALRWIVEQLAFLIVLAVLAAAFGYLIIEPDADWGRSSGVVAMAVLLAAVFRAVAPPARVGMLAVRSRWLDAACYLALGGAILAIDLRLHS